MGPTWDLHGPPLGPQMGYMGPTWDLHGPHLGFTWDLHGPHLGFTWAPLRPHLGPIGTRDHLGPTWAPLGPHLGPTWAPLGPHLGSKWAPSKQPTHVSFENYRYVLTTNPNRLESLLTICNYMVRMVIPRHFIDTSLLKVSDCDVLTYEQFISKSSLTVY